MTTKCYNIVTMIFDQSTILVYAQFQTTESSEAALKYEQEFELMSHQHGVKIKAYHVDNDIFLAHSWVNSCAKQSQALTFSGVNAHHKNGISERRIRNLQDLTRTQLVHASKR